MEGGAEGVLGRMGAWVLGGRATPYFKEILVKSVVCLMRPVREWGGLAAKPSVPQSGVDCCAPLSVPAVPGCYVRYQCRGTRLC